MGQVVFAVSTVDETNLVGLRISACTAAESDSDAHQVMVVKGFIGSH